MQTAEDFRDLHQLEKSFKLWRDYTVMKQIERKQNQITAVNHYERYLESNTICFIHILIFFGVLTRS